MKNKFLTLLHFSVILFLLVGCGENSSVSSEEKSEEDSVSLSIKKVENAKVFSKQSLSINYMNVEVYEVSSASDESYVDASPIKIEPFSKVNNEWTVSLKNLEKERFYVFVVKAFSANEVDISKLIFKGIKHHQIVEGINAIEVNLEQTANANTIQNLPSVTSIVATKLSDDSIELSFNIANPYEEALTWEIFNEGATAISSDFSSNSGSTNTLSTDIKVNYLLLDENSYILRVSSDDATITYHFTISIDANSGEVRVIVDTAPIIIKLMVSVVGNQLSLTPELDKVANAYAWEIVENLGSAISIDNASAQNVTLSDYNTSSKFKIKLTVSSESGAFSYRIYYIGGNHSSTEVVVPPISTTSSNIKKTSQIKSYDYLGEEKSDINDDGHYKKGITPSYERDDTTNIVTDKITNLMWQDKETVEELKWVKAKDSCEASSLGGFNDWRLPSMRELDSIVAYFPEDPFSTTHSILLNQVFKQRGGKYWSSFSYTGYPNTARAWYVDYVTGNHGGGKGNQSSSYAVRCVRGTLATPQFSKDIATGIVRDSYNKLEWQDNNAFVAESWTDAMNRCEALSLGELGESNGWRLPNINELKSIVERHNNPRIASAFTSNPSFGNSYWSSTAYFNSKGFAMTVGVLFGSSHTVTHIDKSLVNSAIYSRCVRDVSSSGEQ